MDMALVDGPCTWLVFTGRVHTGPVNTGSVFRALVINILPVVNFDVVSVQE